MPSSAQRENLPLAHVSRGLHLEKAVIWELGDFVRAWMTNGQEDREINNWKLLYTDDTCHYFGFPTYATALSKALGTSCLCKVERSQMEKEFPRFRELEGFHVRSLLYQHISHFRERRGLVAPAFVDMNFHTQLLHGFLVVEYLCPFAKGGQLVDYERFRMVVDTHGAQVLELVVLAP